MRVISNSVTDGLNGRFLGHDPENLQREVIAWDGDHPRLRFSTDSPLRTTSGDLEPMALYAGRGVGAILDIPSAAVRLTEMVTNAADLLESSYRTNCEAVS